MTNSPLSLSVLDLIPVRSTQNSSDAIAASIALAQRADELGYRRYWVAEHHNMPSVVSTNPPVLIGIIAANTQRIRVGSGGVMLPNHAPLVIAEQFGILEAAFPGRIDLGIGRAPGSDPVITSLLRSSGAVSEVDAFPRNIGDIAALLHPDGASLGLHGGRTYEVRATPRAVGTPMVWLLGSSEYSANLAASEGMPYVFANHFQGDATTQALDAYRRKFQPSELLAEPRTFLTVNVSVADTTREANALALPQMQQMARLRSGQKLSALATVEEAAATQMTPSQQDMIDLMEKNWVIGEPAEAAARIRELAAKFGVDEVMVGPEASAHADADPMTSPDRVRALELLAEQLLEPSADAAANFVRPWG
ncbi:LLM class flavin-dependent oxidoreductase [Cryobacterium sp. Y11]|uniref:LLM class flavin-dependent oxidoreductase n=1 Tax=Cryobacterium sp. Y11 TaxID=2045016 RepID=UPI000CE44EF7|nr:LLM class flavin-dependent oxidoreductase [Cryobacterium sp. Y11]